MKLNFILAVVTIFLGVVIHITILKKNKNFKNNIFLALLTGVIAITILVYPLQQQYTNTYTRILASFFYAIKCAGMGQNLEILSRINMNSITGNFYFILLNILFIVMPIIAVGFILSFLEDVFVKVRLFFINDKELHIFSEVNEKSIILAKKMQNEKNVQLVFTNVADKSKISFKTIVVKEKITDLKLKNKSKIEFYMISSNEEENLNKTLELIEKYRNADNVKINVINDSEQAITILDSTDKGKITVEIINEKERAVFNLLNDKPTFLNSINKTISILIVGCGNLGKEFLKAATWCSIIEGYKLKILVIDINACKIRENINAEAPEFLENYDISFLESDVKSAESLEILKQKNDINYILVSMDNDEKNLETAIMLRRLFLREFLSEPIINLWVSNEHKRVQISNIVNEKKNSYNLNTFGSVENLYYQNNIVNSELEKLAIQIHLFYDSDDVNLKRYNLIEYNKRSSRASALHIKYKIFSILGDDFTSDMKENQKIFNQKYSKKVEDILVKNEHDRWVAYTRSIGYVCASIDKVSRYYNKSKSYIYYLARMHPALVEFDKLDKVSKDLSKICNEKIDLKESDRKIIKSIFEKIEM